MPVAPAQREPLESSLALSSVMGDCRNLEWTKEWVRRVTNPEIEKQCVKVEDSLPVEQRTVDNPAGWSRWQVLNMETGQLC